MSGLFLLSARQMERISPFFPLAHGVPRVDDRRVVGGIVYVIKPGLQWKDAPKGYGPHKTLYNRFIRWSRLRVYDRIFASLAADGPIALKARGTEPCIPPRRNRKAPLDYDKTLSRKRHKIENLFAKLRTSTYHGLRCAESNDCRSGARFSDHDAVFGPAADGGYWAVGFRRRPRFVDPFRDANASTAVTMRIETISSNSAPSRMLLAWRRAIGSRKEIRTRLAERQGISGLWSWGANSKRLIERM
jgi:transposase